MSSSVNVGACPASSRIALLFTVKSKTRRALRHGARCLRRHAASHNSGARGDRAGISPGFFPPLPRFLIAPHFHPSPSATAHRCPLQAAFFRREPRSKGTFRSSHRGNMVQEFPGRVPAWEMQFFSALSAAFPAVPRGKSSGAEDQRTRGGCDRKSGRWSTTYGAVQTSKAQQQTGF